MAEWVEVGVNDYKTAHDVGENFGKFMSTRSYNEYDCKEAKMRVTYQARFSKNMGKGKKEVETSANFDWYPVVPSTHDELL